MNISRHTFINGKIEEGNTVKCVKEDKSLQNVAQHTVCTLNKRKVVSYTGADARTSEFNPPQKQHDMINMLSSPLHF
jgi:hypothetical protein